MESCVCHHDFCEKDKKAIEEDMSQDEYEEEEYDSGLGFQGIITKETKKTFSLPSDVINMKVKANPIIQHKTDPWSLYKEIDEIGFGTYGVVKKVCLKDNPDIVRALKIIPKDRLIQGFDDEKLSDEILILKNLAHPNIMKLYEFFVDENNFYMVSEYCDQGDLYGKRPGH